MLNAAENLKLASSGRSWDVGKISICGWNKEGFKTYRRCLFRPLKSFATNICMNELKNLKCCQSRIILTHQESFSSLILLFPDDMLFVLRLVMTARSITAYIYCTL